MLKSQDRLNHQSTRVLVLFALFGFASPARRVDAQDHVLTQSHAPMNGQSEPGLERSPLSVTPPPEFQLAGVWSFVATTYGVPSRDGGKHVQQGHWAIVHDGNAYMTAYSFDKANAFGRRFLISASPDRTGNLSIQCVDVGDNYTKRLGICEISNDGSIVRMAFCMPLDGSLGEKPTSFDPKLNAKGFSLIELNRLTTVRPDAISNVDEHGYGR